MSIVIHNEVSVHKGLINTEHTHLLNKQRWKAVYLKVETPSAVIFYTNVV